MHIGLVSADFYPNVGGVAAHVVELGKALVELGHTVDVVTLPLGDQRQRVSELHGMTVHRPAIPKGQPLYSWLLSGWLRKFTAKQKLDVLHVHGVRPLEATRGLPVPIVFTNHTSGFLKRVEKGESERKRVAKRLMHVARVLAPSDELVEATKTVGYTGPVDFISNGVDTDRFSPGPASRREWWGVAPEEVVVLLARRLVEKNGVTVFADAVTRLKSRGWQVVFAGDGAERANVERILEAGDRMDRCVFLDSVPNAEMPDVYRSADISVLPSFMEATSITGLESMATGLPLVGTRVGGIPTLIKHEETGLMVDSHNAGQLAEALDRLIDDPGLRFMMGGRARERAVEFFSWSRIAQQTVDAYHTLQLKAAG